MEIRPAGAPVDDPFWAAVRRRHPDIDLVLLPPEPEPGTSSQPADDETVARTLTEAGTEAAALWAAAAALTNLEPETRLRPGGAPGTVRAVARVVDHRSDGYGVLVSLRTELERRGWHVDRPAGGLERLVGTRDGATVKASYAEQTGVVVFETASAQLRVAD